MKATSVSILLTSFFCLGWMLRCCRVEWAVGGLWFQLHEGSSELTRVEMPDGDCECTSSGFRAYSTGFGARDPRAGPRSSDRRRCAVLDADHGVVFSDLAMASVTPEVRRIALVVCDHRAPMAPTMAEGH